MQERRVVIVVFDGVQPLDAAGPHEVFAGANAVLAASAPRSRRYSIEVVAPRTGAVRAESGLGLVADGALADVEGRIDTLLVAGGDGVYALAEDASSIRVIASLAKRSRRVASVCSGAFVLAAAGLLAGRRATTHWARAGRLARLYPDVEVDPDPIFVRSGKVWTSAGVTAGIDLALAMVEDDHDAEVAQVVARWLVMFLRRPGGQTQFATPVWSEAAEREPVRHVQHLVHTGPDVDLSVAALARHACMSERNFVRVFTREVGMPPARYVEHVRVEHARRLLEQGQLGVAPSPPHPASAAPRRCGGHSSAASGSRPAPTGIVSFSASDRRRESDDHVRTADLRRCRGARLGRPVGGVHRILDGARRAGR